MNDEAPRPQSVIMDVIAATVMVVTVVACIVGVGFMLFASGVLIRAMFGGWFW